MAMTKTLWSINGLATELGLDRRTVAKRLGDVPPDGTTASGHKGWFLPRALRFLGGEEARWSEPPPVPPGFEAVEQFDHPFDRAILMTLLYFVYRIGPLAASLAVSAGAPMRVAYALHNMMIAACAIEAEEFCTLSGLEPRTNGHGEGIFNLAALEQTNWEALAEMAGEPVNMGAWQDWSRERGLSLADAS
jgi:hypothetical protein